MRVMIDGKSAGSDVLVIKTREDLAEWVREDIKEFCENEESLGSIAEYASRMNAIYTETAGMSEDQSIVIYNTDYYEVVDNSRIYIQD